MKNKLFLIAFTALFCMNTQASSIEDIIKQNPTACAVASYVLGTVGYNLCSTFDVGRAVTLQVNYNHETKSRHGDEKKVSDVRGIDFAGVTMFASNIQTTNYQGDIVKDVHDIKIEMQKLNKRFIPKNSASICFDLQNNKSIVVALDPQAIGVGMLTGMVYAGIAWYIAKK